MSRYYGGWKTREEKAQIMRNFLQKTGETNLKNAAQKTKLDSITAYETLNVLINLGEVEKKRKGISAQYKLVKK